MENNSGSEPETEKSTAKAYSTSDKKNTHSRTQRFITRFFNVRAWAVWDRSKAITQYFLRVFERVLIPKKLTIKHKTASFDAVVAQLNLSEKELQARARGLLRLSYILGFMAFGLLCYMGYQMLYGSLKAILISLIEMIVAAVLAFRYHFWHFQIHRRRLGCSIKEWFQTTTGGDR